MNMKRLRQKRQLKRMSGATHYPERSAAISKRERKDGRVVCEKNSS